MENLEINGFDNLDFEVQPIYSVDTFFGSFEDESPVTTKTLTSSVLI